MNFLGRTFGWRNSSAARPEYDAIKPKFVMLPRRTGGRATFLNWHKEKSVKEMVTAAGMGDLYNTFYKEASSIIHADSFISLVREADGNWEQVVNPVGHEAYDSLAVYFAYRLIADLFRDVSVLIGIDHAEELKAAETIHQTGLA
jgi:hypothetical protein